MNRYLWILALAILFGLSCFSLEPFYFENTKLDEYFKPEDMAEYEHYRGIIPGSRILPDSFVVGADTIYGFWALRPGDGQPIYPPPVVVTVLYSHGNEDNINAYWDRVELLWELGCRVYIYDYPGYGRSQGEPCSRTCFESAETAFEQVRGNPLVDTSRIVFYGFSLGTYMATYLAAEVSSPAASILEAAPASTSALIKDSGLLGVPGGVVSGDDFSNEKRIANIGCPLLMIHGRDDDYLVFERHALLLWELAQEPKDSLWVEGAVHGDIPYVAGDAYGEEIDEFLNEHLNLEE